MLQEARRSREHEQKARYGASWKADGVAGPAKHSFSVHGPEFDNRHGAWNKRAFDDVPHEKFVTLPAEKTADGKARVEKVRYQALGKTHNPRPRSGHP